LKFYLDMTYRDIEEWLLATDKVCVSQTDKGSLG
jgi:hypothetical protein